MNLIGESLHMNEPEVFAPIDDLGTHDALGAWRWLVGLDAQARLFTAMGDVFILKAAELGSIEEVWLLDTYKGEQKVVAPDWSAFKQRMSVPDAQVSEWLKYELLYDLHASGKRLLQGQCFSPTVPPALGGKFELSNFAATPWRVHMHISSQIHQQIRQLPGRTRIQGIDIDSK